jgi:putative ABC transport system permease protein
MRRAGLAERLLARTLPDALRDAVLGDLAEERALREREVGAAAAEAWHRSQALRSLAPALLHRLTHRPRKEESMRRFFDARLHDLRFGARTFSRNPGFAAAAILVLGLGLGAATAVFTVVEGVLLRPLPYPQPERLVDVSQDGDEGSYWLSAPNYLDMKAGLSSFARMTAYTPGGANLVVHGRPERVESAEVDADFFATLGIEPALGRTFTEAERRSGAPVVVIGHGLWERLLGARPGAIGATLVVDGVRREVIGVLPAGPTLPAGAEVWAPLELERPEWKTKRGITWIRVLGRLAPGGPLEAARAEAGPLAAALRRDHPINARLEIGFRSLADATVGEVKEQLWVLMAAAALVLLVAAVNVGGLLVARASARRQEVAVRSALGGSRWRLGAQLLTESALLAVLGCAAGLATAWAGVRWLLASAPPGTPRLEEVRLDFGSLAFAAGASALGVLFFGCLPLVAALGRESGALRSARAGGGRGTARLRSSLVVAQAAMALALLAGAGLMAKSVWRLHRVDPGFDASRVLVAGLPVADADYATPEGRRAHFRRLRQRVERIPGVESAALTSSAPFAGYGVVFDYAIPEVPFAPGESFAARFRVVEPALFRTLRIPMRRGRAFEPREGEGDGPGVAIVSEELAALHFAGRDAVGAHIDMGSDDPYLIVGVAGAVRDLELDRPSELPHVYVPLTPARGSWDQSLVVRAAGDPAALADTVRRAIQEVAPAQPVTPLSTIEELAGDTVASRRFVLRLLLFFSLATLLLSAVGLYGVLASAVASRRREIGVRLALGARGAQIQRLVVGKGLALAGSGVALGLALAVWGARFLEGMLFEVGPLDPAVLGGVAALLVAVALLAAWLPARRAVRVAPLEAMRPD